MKNAIGIIAVLMAAGSGTLFASLSETFTHVTPVEAVPPAFTDNFTFPTFDISLGTLTNVSITVVDNTTAMVDIVNLTGNSQAYSNAQASVPITVTGPDGLSTFVTALAGPFSGTVTSQLQTFLPGAADTSTATVSISSGFAAYENPPSGVSVAITTILGAGTYSGTASGVSFGGGAEAGATTSITYTYDGTATPEPGMYAILAVGLAGLLLANRKRLTILY